MSQQASGRAVNLDGDAIRTLRTQKGWNQEALAEATGLSLKTIRRIENGKPTFLTTALMLAEALGTKCEDILKDRSLPTPPPIGVLKKLINPLPIAELDLSVRLAQMIKGLEQLLGGSVLIVVKVEGGSTLITVEMDEAGAGKIDALNSEWKLLKLGIVDVVPAATESSPGWSPRNYTLHWMTIPGFGEVANGIVTRPSPEIENRVRPLIDSIPAHFPPAELSKLEPENAAYQKAILAEMIVLLLREVYCSIIDPESAMMCDLTVVDKERGGMYALRCIQTNEILSTSDDVRKLFPLRLIEIR